MSNVIKELSRDYPLLYLDPDVNSRDEYRRVVLAGAEPFRDSLEHYAGDDRDMLETIQTPVGDVRVLTLGNRHDFELVCRGIMAAKNGPESEVPKSQGAAMFTVFNWGRINAHLSGFPEEERGAELKRFTADKGNYVEMLVVLSIGPYSNIPAEVAGEEATDWLKLSNIIRRDHELTHVICRKKYPDNVDAIRDELIADAVGLYSAYGCYRQDLAKLFLGISTSAGAEGLSKESITYTGGRLENYTDEPKKEVKKVCDMIAKIQLISEGIKGESAFDLIAPLMEQL